MKNFYQSLTRQPEAGYKSEALRQASLRLLKDRRYRHPFYWAGFVLIGVIEPYPQRRLHFPKTLYVAAYRMHVRLRCRR
jgi:hypothetical protein